MMTKLDIIYKIAQMQEILNQISKAVVEDLEEGDDGFVIGNASPLEALLKVGEKDG